MKDPKHDFSMIFDLMALFTLTNFKATQNHKFIVVMSVKEVCHFSFVHHRFRQLVDGLCCSCCCLCYVDCHGMWFFSADRELGFLHWEFDILSNITTQHFPCTSISSQGVFENLSFPNDSCFSVLKTSTLSSQEIDLLSRATWTSILLNSKIVCYHENSMHCNLSISLTP